MVSLNVNGLQSKAKRRALFRTCRQAKYEFSLFQETHSTADIESTWKAEWGGHIVFCHRDSNSRGVAILVRRGSEYEIEVLKVDEDGRYLIVRAVKGQESFLLVNIYAPTQDLQTEQIDLIDVLEELIVESGEPNILMGGDFNLCMDNTLDRAPSPAGTSRRGTLYKERVTSLLDTLQLEDVWRR